MVEWHGLPDTGCVFGGKLTALRYPEMTFQSVPARQVYFEPVKPLHLVSEARSAQAAADDMLDLADVSGKRLIETRLHRSVTIAEPNAAAALETMSRFAVNPKWLIYLPPTMSPAATSEAEGLLEHPDQAFDYFAGEGVSHVICEEKHMGSRAILAICRDTKTAQARFGSTGPESGEIITRTGRPFFAKRELGKRS